MNEPLEFRDTSTAHPLSKLRRMLFFRFGLGSLLLLMIPLGLGFAWLHVYLDNRHVHWIDFSRPELERHLNEGRTVLVNFRADWACTFVHYEAYFFARPEVVRSIRTHNIIALRADWTNGSPEIKAELLALKQGAIPVVAIYPAATPDDPIVLAGPITVQELLDALQQAEN